MELIMATPLHLLVNLWHEINGAVQASIEQHLVLSSPLTARHFNLKPISANLGSTRQVLFAYISKIRVRLCQKWSHSATRKLATFCVALCLTKYHFFPHEIHIGAHCGVELVMESTEARRG